MRWKFSIMCFLSKFILIRVVDFESKSDFLTICIFTYCIIKEKSISKNRLKYNNHVCNDLEISYMHLLKLCMVVNNDFA